MERHEINLITKEQKTITVIAYQNSEGGIILLDDGISPNPGYLQISDEAAQAAAKE